MWRELKGLEKVNVYSCYTTKKGLLVGLKTQTGFDEGHK
tara:strand:+ start:40 stop:156 length:117 start_codon:yes stop_codon:yes gene_type:complete